jgi:hypothetical protein
MMKRLSLALLLMLLLSSVAAPPTTQAQRSGPAVNGDFHFNVGDGVERLLEFNARTDKNGQTTGEMTFNDPGEIPGSENDPANSQIGVFVKAEFDCLVIRGRDAVMSGVITESNVGAVLGHRVLLVVEDNGEGVNAPDLDKLTWGIYEPPATGWIPSDAELPNDQGALSDWLATDAERPEDVGIPARTSNVIGCQTFSLGSYPL